MNDDFIYYELAISKSPLKKYFTYKSEVTITPGTRVMVDFAGKMSIAYVVFVKDNEHINNLPAEKIKNIEKIVDPYPILNSGHIKIALWVIDHYLNPPGKVFDLYFSAAPKIEIKTDIVKLIPENILEGFVDGEEVIKMEAFLERVGKNGKKLLKKYREEGKIEFSWGLKSKNKKNFVKKYDINLTLDEIFSLKLTQTAREILEFILFNGKCTYSTLRETLKLKSRSSLNTLLKKGYLKEFEIDEESEKQKLTTRSITLTQMQKNICEKVKNSVSQAKFKHLIYGITGSGKTEVYSNLIEYYHKPGTVSFFMLPEISLTPQLIKRISSKFTDLRVEVFHSLLTKKSREEVWKKTVNGEVDIVLGTRSALWLPADKISMIVLDEEHDESYMQSENSPVYDSIYVSETISDIMDIPLIMGSATPRIESFYHARNGRFELHMLTERPKGAQLPKVELVDMDTAEKMNYIISKKLIEGIDYSLKKKGQAFILVGNKGFSSYAVCNDCGYVFKCENCDVSMTRHVTSNLLKCHYCGNETDIPNICTNCSSPNIVFKGFGTEKIELMLKKLFPSKTIMRVDRENITSYTELEKAFDTIKRGKVDIVVGTRMISKGLDFPGVYMVGIINADQLLYFPDFRSNERTFQLLSQMSGRAGRSIEEGRVIIQTTSPDSYPIVKSVEHAYMNFFDREIEQRELAKYPPFCELIAITTSSEKYEEAEIISGKLSETLKNEFSQNDKIEVLGPVQPLIPRIMKNHRFNILIKNRDFTNISSQINEIVSSLNSLEKNIRVIVDPIKMII